MTDLGWGGGGGPRGGANQINICLDISLFRRRESRGVLLRCWSQLHLDVDAYFSPLGKKRKYISRKYLRPPVGVTQQER